MSVKRAHVEQALARGETRAALRLLEQMRRQSLRARDVERLQEVLAIARAAQSSATRRDAYELGRLAFAVERNLEALGGVVTAPSEPAQSGALESRVVALEAEVETLRAGLAQVRRELAGAAPAAPEPLVWKPEAGPPPRLERAGRRGERLTWTPPSEAPAAPRAQQPLPERTEPLAPKAALAAEPRPKATKTEPALVERALEALRQKSAAWILAWAGGIVTALGVVLLFALAVNRGWIGPEARVAVGGAVSTLVFGSGVWARRRFGALYSALGAVGAGIAGGYATLFAATALYDLLPAPAALVAAAGVAAAGVAASLEFRSELVAGLGLIGAMVAPLGVYDGEATLLGTAFAAFMLAAVGVVSARMRWSRLALVGSLASLPQFVAVSGGEPEADPRLLALGTAFSVLYLGMAVAHQRVSDAEGLRRLPAWLVLASAYVAGAGLTAVYDSPVGEGLGLLVVALLYGAVAVALLRSPRLRELGALVAVVALTIGAGAMADLFSGRTLAVVWALEAGLLAWLAKRAREPRFQLAALVYFGLAFGHSLVVEVWPRALFQVSEHPATSWPTLLALAAGAAALGSFTPAFGVEDVARRGVFRVLAPLLDALCSLQRALRVGGLFSAAAFTIVTLSLAILELAVRLGPTTALGFDRGQVAVDALWAIVAVAAVWVGWPRRLDVAAAGCVWLAVLVAKAAGYDAVELVRPERSLALIVAGSAVLLGAFAVRSVSLLPVAALVASVPLVAAGALELAHGDLAGADADGFALFAVAAGYAALAAACFRRERDFASLLWVTALGLVAAAWPVLVSGTWLVLAWAGCAVVLATLAELLSEKRFLPAAYALLALAAGSTLVVEAPPADLFSSQLHPGRGVPALVIVVAAAAFVALICRRTAPAEEPASSGSWYSELAGDLEERQPRWAAATAWVAAGLAVYVASLAILELAQAVSPGTIDVDFQRGHVAVSALWGVIGLALLYAGLVRRSRALRYAGFVLFALAVGKIFLYDLANLSAVARALSFLGVGGILLLGGFFYQRLTSQLGDGNKGADTGARRAA